MTLRIYVSAGLLCLAGCKFYNDDLLKQTNPIISADGGSDMGTPTADGGAADRDGGQSVVTATSSCGKGQCWWSHEQDGCASASFPTLDGRPSAPDGDASSELPAIYLGWTQLQFDGADVASMDSMAQQNVGFDLDGVCTNSATCGTQHDVQSCKARAQQIPFDGEQCRDNALANVLLITAQLPDVGTGYGLSQDALNCGLWRGTYNVLMRISGYNGRPDDDKVRVDWYTSSGLERESSWTCPSDNYRDTYPLWRASATWRVDESELSEPISTAGQLPESHVADDNAYVHNHYLVSRLPDGAVLRFAGDGKPFRGLALPVVNAVWTGKLSKGQDSTWRVQDGLVGGRLRIEDVMKSIRQTGFCRGVGLDTLYESISTYVDENADVLASGAVDATKDCDAMSFGIAFEAAQVTPGSAAPLPDLIECCMPGTADGDCGRKCGDGKLNGDERCDIAIAAGQSGACPSDCGPADGCMRNVLVGDACDAHCEPMPITDTISGDGCCPIQDGHQPDAQTDSDCAAKCGNGVLEAGETCDPSASCPACDQSNACLTVMQTGSANECTAECKYTPVTDCKNDDGCCPMGCTMSNDNDCNTKCGNGQVDRELGETCEANTNTPCPTRCTSNDPCQLTYLTGSADACTAQCTKVTITKADNGDHCCPLGANANTDSDCQPVCGNSIVEPNEDCDDGNRDNGDGCNASCKKETPTQTCLEQVGTDDACSQCVCTACQQDTARCYGASNADEVRRCADMIDCVRKTSCRGSDCYCGNDFVACTFGAPSGPCIKEVEAAAGSNVGTTISLRSTDLSSPLGRAASLGECAWNNCAKACGF